MQLKYLFLFASFQLITVGSMAQNIPVLTQTSNPNSFSDMTKPAEVYIGAGMLNSVTTLVPTLPTTDTSTVNSSSPATDVKQQVVYLDGFQRPFQSVTQNVANIGGVHKNLIQIYDNRPQQDQYSFLPYSSNGATLDPNAFQNQKAYYNNLFPNEGYSSFSKAVNTSNSTERSTSTYSSGRSGVGLEIGSKSKTVTNPASQVIIWNIDVNGTPVNQGYYQAGVLTGVEGADPDAIGSTQTVASSRARVYKDKDGKAILKLIADSSYTTISGGNVTAATTYTYTYYVYDAKGDLRVTITPKAFKYYQSQGSFSTTILNNLCFQYQYDSKGRQCGIRKPGEGDFTYIVFDRKDRPIMNQSPNERPAHEWEVVFMDVQGRPKVTSIYTDVQATPLDHNGWQNAIDTYSGSGTYADLLNYLVTPSMEFQYPVSDNPVSDPANNAYGASYIAHNNIMTINYYDSYSKLDATNTLFNECQDTLNLPLQTINGQEPPLSGRPYGLATGSIIRILRSPNATNSTKVGDWLTTINFNDDKGRIIATKSFVIDNVTSGHPVINTDYSGTQYDFANHVLVSGHVFNNINSRDNALTKYHSEYTKNQYDEVTGSIIKSVHQVDGTAWKTLATFVYDDMGRTTRHTLGAGGEVEDMTYNIRGQLTGINGVYAETANKGGVSKTFGESLKYDFGFTKPRYDGKLAGMVWRGSSALDMYAYGYDYTQNGALKTADFNHIESGVWKHTTMDYSVSNLFYDKNGNMIHMKQRGSFNGNVVTAPFDMDDLSYTYESGDISNRLSQVTENATIGDYGAGDFRGTANNTYDANGNMITNSGNKGISGISYTRFNKPLMISYTNSSSIEYSYDALGNKVEELIIDKPNVKRKRTDYIGNVVYQNRYLTSAGDGNNTDSLQYISTAEGRTTFNFSTRIPSEEFYVKDHLGNVRSTINVSGYEMTPYLTSYEIASANLDDLVFDNLDDIRDIRPGGEGDNTMAANLNGGDPQRIIGSSLLLHVMAGDKVAMNVSTFYNDYDASSDEVTEDGTVLNSIISTLTGGVGGFEGSESHDTKLVQSVFTPENYSVFSGLIRSNTDDSKPKAYLNYALFDERMQLVTEMTGAFQATGTNDWVQVGTTAALEVPVNGYMAVYLSNTSKSDVYFDQLSIQLSHGNLLEENHYYPHGLPIFGLGSTTTDVNYRNNRKKYQTKEYITDQGLNWMSFGARQYDPQIGRFLSVDPLAQFGGQDVYSPYVAMGNQPESAVDPNGMAPITWQSWVNPHSQHVDAGSGGSGGSFASQGWFSGGNMQSAFDDVGADGLIGFDEAINQAIINITYSQAVTMCGGTTNGGQGGNGVGGMAAADERNSRGKDNYFFQPSVKKGSNWETKDGEYKGIKYHLYISEDRSRAGNDNVGVEFNALVTGKGLDGFTDLNWVQSIKEKTQYSEGNWHWDGRSKDNYPFYNPKSLNEYSKSFAKDQGFKQYFQDIPGQVPTSINAVWTAQTTLIGKKNGVYQAIISFTWGYNYDDFTSYRMSPYVITNLNQTQQNLIKAANP